MNRPTIKDVADRAGVSPMTVSRTLAGVQTVREDLRQKVMAAVVELGYHRNENARSLRPGQSSGLVGVLITNIANPYYGSMVQGIEEVVLHAGKRTLLGDTGGSPAAEEQLTGDFLGRRVDGLIVVPTGITWRHLERAVNVGVPVVVAVRELSKLDVDSVLVDDEGGAYRGTAALLDDGHTNIAFLGNVGTVSTSASRYRGFSRAFEDRGLEVNAFLETPGQQSVKEAAIAMGELLDLDDPPTAVFCANNRNAVGAVGEISTRIASSELAVEDAPVVMSFDDFELSDVLPFPVSVIKHDPKEMGRAAARLLIERIQGDSQDQDAKTVILPTTLRHT